MTGICRLSLLAGVGLSLAACGGAEEPGNPLPGPGSGGTGGQSTTAGTTSTPMAGAAGSTAMMGGAGMGGTGTAGAMSSSGAGGATTAGSGGMAAGGGGGGDPLDTPPTHTLKVDAAPGEHTHMASGMIAGLDNRVPAMVGKLIVNVEVDQGGMYAYGLKHGFHVLGPGMFHCGIAQTQGDYTKEGRDFNGNCRLETFDGMDHDTGTGTGHAMVTPANSISGRVKSALTSLQQMYPEEDWGYFLAADGSVRWSDVGFTGYSHGASSSARWGMQVRLWRVVARSGPRDNICGILYSGKTCAEDVISSWLDETGKTPLDRVYGLAGTTDSEYGDIVFAMERMKYPGDITDINSVPAPYNGSHRLISKGDGHSDFNDKKYWPVMDVVWATPKPNIDYANAH
jgi:hypothetical protein